MQAETTMCSQVKGVGVDNGMPNEPFDTGETDFEPGGVGDGSNDEDEVEPVHDELKGPAPFVVDEAAQGME